LKTGLILLQPFDYLCRRTNGKTHLPPLHLRHSVGPLKNFESSGAEFLVYLKLLCGLRPEDRLLDIGCGCGLMALYLAEFPSYRGSYTGIDTDRAPIRWCQKRVTPRHPNCVFLHAEVRNTMYNPRGRCSANDYVFPFEDESFDLIIAKSVFTHMLSEGVDNYHSEIARLLSPTGRCLETFFLLNEQAKPFEDNGIARIDFRIGDDDCRFIDKDIPEKAVAYREDYLISILRKHQLRVREPIYYGTWSGREGGLSYQDLVVVERS